MGVLFAELAQPELGDGQKLAATLGFWYGVLDDTSWRSVEQIRIPLTGNIRLWGMSSLVVSGGVLAFALPIAMPTYRTDVLLFERRNGRWQYEPVGTQRAAYVALAPSPGAG